MQAGEVTKAVIDGTSMLFTWGDVQEFALIGSAMYLPPEKVADVDFVVLLKPGREAMEYLSSLSGDGWQPCGDYDTEGGLWGAVRRGDLNLMVTHDRAFYDGYKLAMEVCKVLRLENKDHRIAVCRVVRDRKSADQVLSSMPKKEDLF